MFLQPSKARDGNTVPRASCLDRLTVRGQHEGMGVRQGGSCVRFQSLAPNLLAINPISLILSLSKGAVTFVQALFEALHPHRACFDRLSIRGFV